MNHGYNKHTTIWLSLSIFYWNTIRPICEAIRHRPFASKRGYVARAASRARLAPRLASGRLDDIVFETGTDRSYHICRFSTSGSRQMYIDDKGEPRVGFKGWNECIVRVYEISGGIEIQEFRMTLRRKCDHAVLSFDSEISRAAFSDFQPLVKCCRPGNSTDPIWKVELYE